MQRFINRFHTSEQQLLEQIYRQQFGVASLPLPGINYLTEQFVEVRLMHFIRTEKPVCAKIAGQVSHSCQ